MKLRKAILNIEQGIMNFEINKTSSFGVPCSIFIILFFIFNFSFSQPAIQWEKSFGGSGNDFARFQQQTNDGGFILVGYSNSTDGDVTNNHGGFDVWVMKIDSLGNLLWQKSIGGTGLEVGNNIAQTNDHGYVISGYSSSNDTNITGNHGGYDVLVIKLDSAGNEKWKKVYGGSNNDGNIESGILPVNDGGFMIATNSFSDDGDVSGNHGGNDWWIFKIDSAGNLKWQKCLGGSGSEDSHTIIATSDSGFIIAGHTGSSDGDVGPTKGMEDEWIVKIDSAGNIKWSKTFGGSSDDAAFYLTQTNDRGYAITGFTNSTDGDVNGNHGGFDSWLIKLDSAGNMKWQKTFGGSSGDYGIRIFPSAGDNGFALAGYSNSTDGDVTGNHGGFDYWILKTDSLGTIQWEQSYGGSGIDYSYGISPVFNGYMISGFSNSPDGDVTGNHGAMDVWAARLCIPPTAVFSATDDTVCTGSTINFINTSINAGSYQWQVNGNTISSAVNFSYTFNVAGTFTVNLIAVKGGCSDSSNKIIEVNPLPIASFADSNFVIIVNFYDSSQYATSWYWNFGDGDTSTQQNPVHDYSAVTGFMTVCLTVANSCGTDSACKIIAVNPLSVNGISQNPFSVYPTVFSEGINITSSSNEETKVSVFDLLSREVFELQINQSTYLSLPDLDRGVYILKINSFTTKIIKGE